MVTSSSMAVTAGPALAAMSAIVVKVPTGICATVIPNSAMSSMGRAPIRVNASIRSARPRLVGEADEQTALSGTGGLRESGGQDQQGKGDEFFHGVLLYHEIGGPKALKFRPYGQKGVLTKSGSGAILGV